MAVQADREAYEVGPELLAAGKLPLAPSGMAFGGENGPDPAAYDIMNTDDFGIWQNMTMDSSSGSRIARGGQHPRVRSLFSHVLLAG